MKRALALLLCLALLCPAALAAEPDGPAWRRTEPGGRYVTVRLDAVAGAEDMDWQEQQRLAVRYADTHEPAPLSSELLEYEGGAVYVTVPASEAGRPLEVYLAEEAYFPDCLQDWGMDVPTGAKPLAARGVVQGDRAGNLNAARAITRAEAAAMLARLLSLEPGGAPGYGDVPEGAWYRDAVSALRAAGIASADGAFQPDRLVTRAEFMTFLARAMAYVGWLTLEEDGGAQLPYEDASAIPAWARPAYAVLDALIAVNTQAYTGEADPVTGEPAFILLAEPGLAVTREEAIASTWLALRRLPCYPTELAIEWGFADAMPVVDGSTSTYPYTTALYGELFHNHEMHPAFPEVHSKSHASYERLIAGEVDALFAATPPSSDLEALAEAAGVELEIVPIAYDAMVFFTNGENVVDGLTRQQIQDIYVSGAYDNWSQLGGDDAALLPYRRNTDSGSHALMERYFLEGGKLSLSPDVHNVLTSYGMTSALTDVADAMTTDPPAYAIGYSVYYYYVANQWLLDGGAVLKLLAVDGVHPTEETIADGSYPLAGYNYVVYRADEPADSPARRLADFLRSPDGQRCVASAGFGPLYSDPKADLEARLPGWTVEAVFPAPDGNSYLALSRSDADGTLRGSWLRRVALWGEFLSDVCPVPEPGRLSSAFVRDRDTTFVFGLAGDGGPYSVRLTDEQGRVQTCEVSGGGSFSFLPEGAPVLLELLEDGRTIDQRTEF